MARGEAHDDSDIDILVVSPDERSTRKQLIQIRDAMDHESGYRFLISLVHYSREHFVWLRDNGSPFIVEIAKDRVVLYDNGTFSGIHKKAVEFAESASPGNTRRLAGADGQILGTVRW